jgi:hypothetical protein
MSHRETGETKTYWLIQGFDSTTKIYEKRIDASHMTRGQAMSLLKALVAKAGLTFDEIVGAYVKKQARIANGHLSVQKEGPYPVFFCGSNPHFALSIRDSDGNIPGYPKRRVPGGPAPAKKA